MTYIYQTHHECMTKICIYTHVQNMFTPTRFSWSPVSLILTAIPTGITTPVQTDKHTYIQFTNYTTNSKFINYLINSPIIHQFTTAVTRQYTLPETMFCYWLNQIMFSLLLISILLLPIIYKLCNSLQFTILSTMQFPAIKSPSAI